LDKLPPTLFFQRLLECVNHPTKRAAAGISNKHKPAEILEVGKWVVSRDGAALRSAAPP
jgi:hypothetical protein